MTTTETPTDSHSIEVDGTPGTDDSLYRVIASNDHKVIGRLWIGMSLVFLLGMALLAVLTGFERMSLDDIDLFNDETSYFQAWTLVKTSGAFLVVIPLFVGIATTVVPLQLGAPSIAFPRLATAAFWSWLIGAGIHLAAFAADGGLGPSEGTRRSATLLTMSSLGMVVIALLAASVCIATTVIALRPAGMDLSRVPMFSWSMLVACSVWLLSLPVLLANLLYAFVDLQGRDPIAFGNPDRIWADVEWAFQQPQIYSLAIPVLGIAAEIIPVSSRVRQSGRDMLLAVIGLFGFLSFGAWAQHSFSRGADPAFPDGNLIYEEFLYALVAVGALVPLLAVLASIADTIRRGSVPALGAAVIGAMVGLLAMLVAVVVGVIRVIPFFDALHEDRVLLSSATAQFSLVVAAALVSAAAALVWWAPKLFGGYVADGMAMLAIMAIAMGGLAAGVGDTISALLGQRDISLTGDVDSGVETLNLMATIGIVLLAAGALALIAGVTQASTSREVVPDDPWEGHTLEWASPSPPPVGNFVESIPTVSSAEPLLDEFEDNT